MVNANEIAAMFGGFGSQAMGSVIYWAGIGLGIAAVGAVFWIIYVYYSYNVKVEWRWIQGDPGQANKIWLSKRYTDRGKRIKDKGGVPKFKLLWAGNKIKEIPPEFNYPDGVFLLRIDKGTFVPTARPTIEGNPEEQVMKLKPIESDLKFWATLELQDLQQRLTPEDLIKRMIWSSVIVVGIVLVFVALTMWITQQYHLKALAATDNVAGPLRAIAENLANVNQGPG